MQVTEDEQHLAKQMRGKMESLKRSLDNALGAFHAFQREYDAVTLLIAKLKLKYEFEKEKRSHMEKIRSINILEKKSKPKLDL